MFSCISTRLHVFGNSATGSKTQTETTVTTLSASPLQHHGAEGEAVLPSTDRAFQLKVVLLQKTQIHWMKGIWKHLCPCRERCRMIQEPFLGCQETECSTTSLSCLSQAQLALHESPLQPQPPSSQKWHLCSHSTLAGGDSKSPFLTSLNWGHFRSKQCHSPNFQSPAPGIFPFSISYPEAEECEVFLSSCSRLWSSSREILGLLLYKELLRTNPYLQVKHLSFPTILSHREKFPG